MRATDDRSVPDICAYYAEDAIAVLKAEGYKLGSVEFALPPRRFEEAAELSKTYSARDAENSFANIDALPERRYRVLRCVAYGGGEAGLSSEAAGAGEYNGAEEPGVIIEGGEADASICDLLLTEERTYG